VGFAFFMRFSKCREGQIGEGAAACSALLFIFLPQPFSTQLIRRPTAGFPLCHRGSHQWLTRQFRM